jgi:hypothetical protein
MKRKHQAVVVEMKVQDRLTEALATLADRVEMGGSWTFSA